jgi:hypothetical protein
MSQEFRHEKLLEGAREKERRENKIKFSIPSSSISSLLQKASKKEENEGKESADLDNFFEGIETRKFALFSF